MLNTNLNFDISTLCNCGCVLHCKCPSRNLHLLYSGFTFLFLGVSSFPVISMHVLCATTLAITRVVARSNDTFTCRQ